jgi:hypothetical protein
VRLTEESVDRFVLATRVTWRRTIIPGVVRWAVYLLKASSVAFFTLGTWRLGNDVGATQPFFLSEGLFSHWQVYFALCAAAALGASALRRAVPESQLEALMAEAEELAAEGVSSMPPSIRPTIESPCSIEVRRAIG